MNNKKLLTALISTTLALGVITPTISSLSAHSAGKDTQTLSVSTEEPTYGDTPIEGKKPKKPEQIITVPGDKDKNQHQGGRPAPGIPGTGDDTEIGVPNGEPTYGDTPIPGNKPKFDIPHGKLEKFPKVENDVDPTNGNKPNKDQPQKDDDKKTIEEHKTIVDHKIVTHDAINYAKANGNVLPKTGSVILNALGLTSIISFATIALRKVLKNK